MIRVLLVDDQEMIRMGLRAILDAQPGIEVVADVGDGFQALELLQQTNVDVVLMDIRMPGIDGVETTKRLRRTTPTEAVRVIVLTTFDNDANVFAALRAGANGFLSKGVSPTELVAGIEEVAAGGGALSAAAAAALIGHVATEQPRQMTRRWRIGSVGSLPASATSLSLPHPVRTMPRSRARCSFLPTPSRPTQTGRWQRWAPGTDRSWSRSRFKLAWCPESYCKRGKRDDPIERFDCAELGVRIVLSALSRAAETGTERPSKGLRNMIETTTQMTTEEYEVAGDDLLSKVREIIHEGNVRRVIIKHEDGHTLVEIPLNAGVAITVLTVALAPVFVAIGAIAALVTKVTVVVERETSTD